MSERVPFAGLTLFGVTDGYSGEDVFEGFGFMINFASRRIVTKAFYRQAPAFQAGLSL